MKLASRFQALVRYYIDNYLSLSLPLRALRQIIGMFPLKDSFHGITTLQINESLLIFFHLIRGVN